MYASYFILFVTTSFDMCSTFLGTHRWLILPISQTHPSQSCFMSSIDLHTQYPYQVKGLGGSFPFIEYLLAFLYVHSTLKSHIGDFLSQAWILVF